MFRLLASVALGLGLITAATAQERVVNVYNWSDYVDPKALDEWRRRDTSVRRPNTTASARSGSS